MKQFLQSDKQLKRVKLLFTNGHDDYIILIFYLF